MIRTTVFPLVIMMQRNVAVMNNNLPEMQRLQMLMTEARLEGDQLKGTPQHLQRDLSMNVVVL